MLGEKRCDRLKELSEREVREGENGRGRKWESVKKKKDGVS